MSEQISKRSINLECWTHLQSNTAIYHHCSFNCTSKNWDGLLAHWRDDPRWSEVWPVSIGQSKLTGTYDGLKLITLDLWTPFSRQLNKEVVDRSINDSIFFRTCFWKVNKVNISSFYFCCQNHHLRTAHVLCHLLSHSWWSLGFTCNFQGVTFKAHHPLSLSYHICPSPCLQKPVTNSYPCTKP